MDLEKYLGRPYLLPIYLHNYFYVRKKKRALFVCKWIIPLYGDLPSVLMRYTNIYSILLFFYIFFSFFTGMSLRDLSCGVTTFWCQVVRYGTVDQPGQDTRLNLWPHHTVSGKAAQCFSSALLCSRQIILFNENENCNNKWHINQSL